VSEAQGALRSAAEQQMKVPAAPDASAAVLHAVQTAACGLTCKRLCIHGAYYTSPGVVASSCNLYLYPTTSEAGIPFTLMAAFAGPYSITVWFLRAERTVQRGLLATALGNGTLAPQDQGPAVSSRLATCTART
jgi:hypothetical protein